MRPISWFQELLGAKVGFEATVSAKLHSTFVFHAELLHAMSKTQLATWHRDLFGMWERLEPKGFKLFKLFCSLRVTGAVKLKDSCKV